MAITLQDIADKCNVSRVTVSHVLRNPEHPRYSQVTKERVLKVARELQYSPNLVAQNLKRGRTNLLGVVTPFNDPGVIDTFERVAQELGYAVMVQFSPEPNEEAETRALKSAIDRRVDGIIWQPCSTGTMSSEKLRMLRNAKIPVVQIQSRVPHFTQADYVGIDWENAFSTAVKYLKDCGYSRIAYVSFSDSSYEPRGERIEMFQRLAQAEGISGDVLVGDSSEIEQILDRYLDAHDEPFAFFGQEFPTIEVLSLAKRKGRAIPGDIGILVLGDLLLGGKYRLGEITSTTLSAIRIPAVEIAQIAMDTLVKRIKKKHTGSGVSRTVEVSLIERESTRSIK